MDNLGNDITSSAILVTGSTGYLGKRIVDNLKKDNTKVISVARNSLIDKDAEICDLTNINDTREMLESVNPSSIIHCAAAVPKEIDGLVSGYQNIDAEENSLAMALNVAETSKCPIVFISSMTVYDSDRLVGNFVSEEQAVKKPNTLYAQGKYRAEKRMAELTDRGLISLRWPGVCGKPRTSGVLYKAAYSFLSGKKFSLTSTPLWATMHVDDAANSCIKAAKLNNFPENDIVNIGYSDIFNIVDAVKLLAEICGVPWNNSLLSAPYFQANLEKSKKYMLHQGEYFLDRLEQLVADVRSDLVE